MRIGVGIGVGFGRRARRVSADITTLPSYSVAGVPTTIAFVGVATAISGTTTAADGTPHVVTVDGEAWGTAIASGGTWSAAGTPTLAMCGDTVTVDVTVGGASKATATLRVWAPSSLGAKLGDWYSESGAYSEVTGAWTPTVGTHTLALVGSPVPTVGARNNKRTVITTGAQILKSTYTRAQPTETWCAAKFIGALATNRAYFSGVTTAGYAAQLTGGGAPLTGSIRAGTSLAFLFAANPADRWLVLGARFDGTGSRIWENGAQRAAGDAGTGAPGGLSIGGLGDSTARGAMEVGEVIVTAGGQSLSEGERQTLDAYFVARSWV